MRSVFAAFIQSHPFDYFVLDRRLRFLCRNFQRTVDPRRTQGCRDRQGHVGVRRLDNSTIERRAFFGETPLYWWAQSSAVRCCSVALLRPSPGYPPQLFGFAALLLTYALGRSFFSSRTCLVGCLILLSTALFSLTTHWIVVDNALLFAVTGAWTLFAHAESCDGTTRQFLLLGMYVFLAIAFLTKGVVGLGIPALGMGVYLLWSRRLSRFFGWHMVVGSGLIAGAAHYGSGCSGGKAGASSLDTFLVYNQAGTFFPRR